MKKATKINGLCLYPQYTGDEKMVSIHFTPRAVREANKNDIQIYKATGDWTGYAYEVVDRYITASAAKKIRKILKKIDEKNKKKAPKKILTSDEKIEKWAKKLNKLTNCGAEEAREIAQAKIDYEWDRVEANAISSFSGTRIPTWKKMAERKYDKARDDMSSLLSPIKNAEHAYAILSAHIRHTQTDYDTKLEEAKEEAKIGNIDKNEIQQYARLAISQ